MPQNISVVKVDSDTDSIKKVFKHRGRKLSLRVERSNLAFAMGLPLPKAFVGKIGTHPPKSRN